MESQLNAILKNIETLQEQNARLFHDRHDDRIKFAEEIATVRVSVSSLQHRLETIENAMLRLMANSTWLLRILVGAVAVAVVDFALKGGLLRVAP